MQETLHILRDASSPPSGAGERAWGRIASRVSAPHALSSASSALVPDSLSVARVWQRILRRIPSPAASSLFADVRCALGGSDAPAPSFATLFIAHRRSPFQWVKWAAACVVVALVIKSSPLLFFASSSVADSTVLLLPTRGEVLVRREDGVGWVRADAETVLGGPMHIRTLDGEATVVLHDDGVLRLGPDTELFLRDILDRPQSAGDPTVLFDHGRLWVQSLVPRTLGALVVATPFGAIRMHEGSVSIDLRTIADVAVWDRSALVDRSDDAMTIHAGNRVQLWSKNIPNVRRIPVREYLESWASQNLDRDAVHRREIAGKQRSRQAALAGILPTSPLYPVKRAAETVDVFLTLDATERTRKKLSYADSRLNEAAALLMEGEDPTQSLGEYKEAILAVARDPVGDDAALLHEQIAENVADLAAVLPDDRGYVLKQAVLETAQDGDAEEAFFIDTLALLRTLAIDDPVRAQGALDAVRQHLVALRPGENVISLPVRMEALSLLSQVVLLLSADPERTEEEQALLNDVLVYVPVPAFSMRALLSDEEIAKLSAEIHTRVFAMYRMPKSRLNQLVAELRHFRGHPDEGRILRRVYRDFPEGSELTRYVRTTMQNLRVQRIGDRSDVRL